MAASIIPNRSQFLQAFARTKFKVSALVKLRKESSRLELWINKFLKDNGESADKDTAMRDRQRRRQVELEIMMLNLLIDYINKDSDQISGNESGNSTTDMTGNLILRQNDDLSVKKQSARLSPSAQ